MFKYSNAYFTWGLENEYDVYGEPEKVFQLLKEYGYDGVEVPGEPDKINAKELKETLNSYGLNVPAVTGLWGWSGRAHGDPTHPDDKVRNIAVEYCKKCLDMMVILDAKIMNLSPCPPIPVEASVKTLNESFAKTFKECVKYAQNLGVLLPIEPCNRYEGYYGVVNTLNQAKTIIDEVGPENSGIFADIFHMNIEESSFIEAFIEHGKDVVHIHCVDSNRKAPGMGHVDFKSVFETLKSVGFKEYLSVEAIPPKPDPRLIAEKAINYMKTLDALIK